MTFVTCDELDSIITKSVKHKGFIEESGAILSSLISSNLITFPKKRWFNSVYHVIQRESYSTQIVLHNGQLGILKNREGYQISSIITFVMFVMWLFIGSIMCGANHNSSGFWVSAVFGILSLWFMKLTYAFEPYYKNYCNVDYDSVLKSVRRYLNQNI